MKSFLMRHFLDFIMFSLKLLSIKHTPIISVIKSAHSGILKCSDNSSSLAYLLNFHKARNNWFGISKLPVWFLIYFKLQTPGPSEYENVMNLSEFSSPVKRRRDLGFSVKSEIVYLATAVVCEDVIFFLHNYQRYFVLRCLMFVSTHLSALRGYKLLLHMHLYYYQNPGSYHRIH